MVSRESLDGLPVQTAVEHAVARLVLRLGGLRVGIAGEDTNKACFVRVPSMNLHDFIDWKNTSASSSLQQDDKVLQAIKDRLEQLWLDVADRPPWKLIVVQDTTPSTTGDIVLDIIFAAHHALADGKSTTVFHTQLLHELNNPTAASPPPELRNHVLTFTTPPVLAPSQEDLVPLTISWAFFLRTLWAFLGPAWLKPKPPALPWTGAPVTLEPHTLNIRLVTLAPATAARLVAACRAHGTTLSGLLHALVLTSLARRVPADVAASFKGDTPISLLPWARLPPGAPEIDLNAVMTDLVTGTNRVWDADTVAALRVRLDGGGGQQQGEDESEEAAAVWPLAKSWRDETRAKVATLPGDDVVGLLKYYGDMRPQWLAKVGGPRDATWELSNVGTIEGTGRPGSAWSVRRTLFSQPVLVAGAAFTVNAAGLEGGPVNLVLNWQETVIDDAVVDGIACDLRAWFAEFERRGVFGIFSRTS